MEDEIQFNKNFTYGETPNMLSGDQNDGLFDSFINGVFDVSDSGRSDNVFSRFIHPEIAEQKQFERENYFVDKANAFNQYMYERALQDNSPAAQMERAREAGINLNMAAAGIMGGSNAVAQPMQSAQGTSGMNTNTASPIGEAATLFKGLESATGAIDKIGQMAGFGKLNNAQINQLNKTADKAAEEADFTHWQKRQFRRTMRIMYDIAQTDLDKAQQDLANLRKLNELYQMQKWETASTINLNVANTEEAKERTKNWQYKNWEEKFKKAFRDLYGVQITESGLNMLVQAVLSGKGKIIIDALSDGIANMVAAAKEKFREHIPNLLNPFDKKTTKWIQENLIKGYEHTKENLNKLKDVWQQMNEETKKQWGNFSKFATEMLTRLQNTTKNAQLTVEDGKVKRKRKHNSFKW